MRRPCWIFGKILPDYGKILQEVWQNPAGCLARSCRMFGKILQDPARSYARSHKNCVGLNNKKRYTGNTSMASI
jgi:hypothetical protein